MKSFGTKAKNNQSDIQDQTTGLATVNDNPDKFAIMQMKSGEAVDMLRENVGQNL